MGLFSFLSFEKEQAEPEPAPGLLRRPLDDDTILKLGDFEYASRHVKILGFTECGKMHATLFLCHAGSGICSEWGTLEFSRLSKTSEEETWECTIGRMGMVVHALKLNDKLSIKIEVDK